MDLLEIQDDFYFTRLQDNFEQSFIRNISKDKDYFNDFQINRDLVNSKEYHDKFKELPLSRRVQEHVYREAGRLLEHVNGHPEEYLIAIDARTGDLVTDNLQRSGEVYKTGFIGTEILQFQECKNQIVLMHNHSLNGRPSGQDLLSFLHQDKVELSLVLCHDGTVYEISYVSPKFEEYYLKQLEEKRKYYPLAESKRIAMTNSILLNNKDNKHKLFNIRRL